MMMRYFVVKSKVLQFFFIDILETSKSVKLRFTREMQGSGFISLRRFNELVELFYDFFFVTLHLKLVCVTVGIIS